MDSFSALPPVPDEQTFLRNIGLWPPNQTDNGGLTDIEDWEWSPGAAGSSSDGIPTGFQQTLLEQPDRHELSTIDSASTSLINDGLSPIPTEGSAPELPYQPSVATIPSRLVRRQDLVHRRYNPEKWISVKETIQRLYIDQGYPLLRVMRILEETYNFTASVRQLRKKLREWGYVKNKKPSTSGSNQDDSLVATTAGLEDGGEVSRSHFPSPSSSQ